MQEWEVMQHQSAAIDMCHRLNVNPFEPLDGTNPGGWPQWVKYARRMAEHEIMVLVMRQYGRPV